MVDRTLTKLTVYSETPSRRGSPRVCPKTDNQLPNPSREITNYQLSTLNYSGIGVCRQFVLHQRIANEATVNSTASTARLITQKLPS